ncbi:MAG: CoB--CoM heterodisulfide reductase iron-sulfur subunit B family protein [Defluviitaleaceae bacterium]|nr:CoB--CoM heterodisulfide reductase iron-sulfur subunit B family protein [Defluviitaleaceae bacterium]
MEYLYYPGCTLKTKAKELDAYAVKSMKALGVDFKEFDDWQCCGAVYPQAKDEIAARLSSIRALDEARKEKRDLLTICSACFHVMKRVNFDIASDIDIRTKANNYLELDIQYAGESKVFHFLEMLRDDIGFDKLKNHVVNPLTGRKIGAYYGCLLLRPSDVMQFDDTENPTIIEDFIRAIGAEPIVYSYRNECCGSYSALKNKDLVQNLSRNIINSAIQKGAESLITACPLCRYGLMQNDDLPVYYFTELLAEALGVK